MTVLELDNFVRELKGAPGLVRVDMAEDGRFNLVSVFWPSWPELYATGETPLEAAVGVARMHARRLVASAEYKLKSERGHRVGFDLGEVP
jgi:hypothetical protein